MFRRSGPSGGGKFWAASSDGSRVFFTDCSQLTPDSTAVPTTECEREDACATRYAVAVMISMKPSSPPGLLKGFDCQYA